MPGNQPGDQEGPSVSTDGSPPDSRATEHEANVLPNPPPVRWQGRKRKLFRNPARSMQVHHTNRHSLRTIWTLPDEDEEQRENQFTEETNREVNAKNGPFAEADGSDKQSCPTSWLDPKGTVTLTVGREGAVRRLVVSSNLKRVSVQWKIVISGGKRQGCWGKRTIRLPDDDADMMLAVMLIIHSRLADVPMKLDFKQLLEIARICRRYDMNEIVDPFLELWVTPHRSKILDAGREQWLYIAHQFGIAADYFALVSHLAINCRNNNQNELLAPGTDQVLSGQFPEDCFADIRRLRVKTLVDFLDTTYTLIAKMVQGNLCCAEETTQKQIGPNERTVCTFYNHGFLVRYLRTQGYWPPILNVDAIEDSVGGLAQILMGLPKISTPSLRNDLGASEASQSDSAFPSSEHAACDVGKFLTLKVKRLLDEVEAPVDPATLATMQRNARKSGTAKWTCQGGTGPSFAMKNIDVEGAQGT